MKCINVAFQFYNVNSFVAMVAQHMFVCHKTEITGRKNSEANKEGNEGGQMEQMNQ